MKILYVTNEIPSLTSGLLRHHHIMEALGARHEIIHFSLTRHPTLKPSTPGDLESLVRQRHVFGLPERGEHWFVRWIGRTPAVGVKLQRALRSRVAARSMAKAVREFLEREPVDVIFFSGKDTFPVIERVPGTPIVADCCDATSLRVRGEMRHSKLPRRLWLLLRLLEVRRIEERVVRATPHLAFVSARDREAMGVRGSTGEIVPQAVDTLFWSRGDRTSEPNTLVFTGVMSYPPNHDAAMYLAREVLPRVRARVPDVRLLLAGKDPSDELIAAEKDPAITVTGFVEDIRDYLAKGVVFVAPIRYASGVQNKVLEAMAMGLPIVTTTVVADGLRMDGAESLPILVADAADEFARHVEELLRNHELRARMSEQARAYVERHFDWGRNIEKVERLCLAAAGHSA
jgi:glycosyltransferase involved in cell wall biosynthesis